MTDHLPECNESMIPDFHNERWICICAALRACEQRVREEWYEAQSEAWEQGFKHGLENAQHQVLDYAEELHQHFGNVLGHCRPDVGDRCDIVSALRVAATRVNKELQ